MSQPNAPHFEPTWESLAQFTIPNWYQDAKFGIFIHWGIFSVPAFDNEWYSRNMYVQGSRAFEHHQKTWGHQSKFGYKDFIPLFKAEKFDPDAWADLFRQAGARYVVPVAEHHDGFAMYDSALSRWTAAKMGPKRDVIGELAAAVRRQNLVFGLSNHRAEHWWFMNGGMKFESDVRDATYQDFYGPAKPGPLPEDRERWQSIDWIPRPDAKFLEDWLARNCELVDQYQPQLIYFDWWIQQVVFAPYLQRFAAYFYNRGMEWNKQVAITDKLGAFPAGTVVFDVERGQLGSTRPVFWQSDTSVAKNSWCYTEGNDYRTSTSIIHDLIDIVSKNGALLLNIGPHADGTIPETDTQILLDIGRWLSVNGEAIYGSRPWNVYGEGPTEVLEGGFTDAKRSAFTAQDIRFTTNVGRLYAICLGWPGTSLTIRTLKSGSPVHGDQIANIEMVGSEQPLSWSQDENGLTVEMPSGRPGDHAYTLKIILK